MLLKNQWQELTGKLETELVDQAQAVAVRYNNGRTMIKTVTKTLLSDFDLSPVISHYQIIK